MPMQADSQTAARPRNAAATRETILTAARERFLMESYDNVGLRDIAGDAGVDVALIGRYFGGKEKLFLEVVQKDPDEPVVPDDIATADLPAFFTNHFMTQDEAEDRDHAELLLIILRSASSPIAARIVRESLHEQILKPIAGRLQGEGAEARASLGMAVWMGVTILKTIMAVGPMCDQKCEVVSAKLALLYEAALSEL